MKHVSLIFILLTTSAAADTLTATRVVRPNAIISAEDLAVANFQVPGALNSAADAVGMEARVTLYPGRPILPAHIGPAAIIERNQPIVLIFRKGSLTISTEARALSRGAVGDAVRVMNIASRNTVIGEVQADGSVEVSQ